MGLGVLDFFIVDVKDLVSDFNRVPGKADRPLDEIFFMSCFLSSSERAEGGARKTTTS